MLYWAIIGALCAPLFVGALGVLLPSFGFEPAFSRYELTLEHWRALGSQPEFWSGLWLSISSGVIATMLAYWFASSLLVTCYHRTWFQRFQSAVTPILSIPHAAITIGLLFLLSPSGWLVRFISPWLSGWDRPPNLLITQDPYGITLIMALVVKEMPYLLFALLAAITQLNPNSHITAARVLGYDRTTAWHFVVLPQLYHLIRLPIFVVLAFNLTVVDVATIIGPNTPSTLAVTLLRWFNDPSLSMRGLASAAAIALTFAVLGLMIAWHLLAKTLIRHRHYTALKGIRTTPIRWLTKLGAIGAFCIIITTVLTLCILPLWSFAKRWRFPDTLPSSWTTDNIAHAGRSLMELSTQSLTLAIASTALALILSLILLEKERHQESHSGRTQRLLYIPIILPQVTLLFGVQVTLLWLDMNGTWYSVAALHTFYSLPYVYLTLKGPYLAYNQAYLTQANRLHPAKWRNFLIIKLAMLKAPILATFAIGFSVSMAQYLPTLMAGEGRITTLTTEAVTRAASGDRKSVSIMALMQAVMPLCVFALAMVIPRYWTQIRLTIRKRFC